MKICFLVVMLLGALVLWGKEDINFAVIDSRLKYEVTVDFDSEEDAKNAALEFLPLPEGKKVAFSTRWDDSNSKHVRMAELLTKYGFKGTFYLNRSNQKFYDEILPKLIVNGHSVGNHTMNHPNLTVMVPNELSRQILRNRVEYEARTNQEINSFVLPYCAYKSGEDKNCAPRIGEALRRSGELGSPEYFQNLEKEYQMAPGTWATSMLFGIDDRKPDFDRFEREVEKRLKKLETQPAVHMTLGLHTWQDDEGFETLARCFEKYGNRPDWWYCNENEYNAYYFMYHNTKVAGRKVEGTKVTFQLEQDMPAMIGSEVPLWAKVSPAAKGGETMIAMKRPDLRPEKIDALFFEKGEQLAAEKFPGLSASLRYDHEEHLLQLSLFNQTEEWFAPLSATYRLPLLYGSFDGVRRVALTNLGPKRQIASSLSFSAGMRNAPIFQSGELFFAVDINFIMKGKVQRLWLCTSYKMPEKDEAVPRDKAMGYGPFPAGAFAPEKAEWSPVKSPKTFLPGFVSIPTKDKEEYALRFKVRAERGADYPFHVQKKNDVKALYLNGKPLALSPFPGKLPLVQGSNELIVILAATRGEKMICISKEGDPNMPLPFE